MRDKKTSSGLGLLDVLVVIFIVLKLLGVITWSWVWVLSPIWIQLVIVAIVFIVILVKDHWLLKKEKEWAGIKPALFFICRK